MVSSNVESERDLARALALEPERREGRSIPRGCHNPATLMYTEHVRYAEQLRRFHEHFPPEQVLVLIYEEFRADNQATIRTVLRFLGVDARPAPGPGRHAAGEGGALEPAAPRHRRDAPGAQKPGGRGASGAGGRRGPAPARCARRPSVRGWRRLRVHAARAAPTRS